MPNNLIDTNQIIDHLRGREEIKDLLLMLAEDGNLICSCCLTIAETLAGAKEKELSKTRKFLESLWYLDTTLEIAETAGRLKYEASRKGLTLSLADALIGATALAHDATLITSNARHFPLEGLKILEMRAEK